MHSHTRARGQYPVQCISSVRMPQLLVHPHGRETLKPYARGIRLNMLALIAYRSYHGTTTVWAFVVAMLIVLVAAWYIRRRR
ncbi:hypothetical protein B0675_23960 [Streptomyces sp. M41(2017)]|nr:hypothetical protein B0675_23960 [Streptomyces sp. M41(2017)]